MAHELGKDDEQKKDGGKLPMQLIPGEIFTALASVLGFGAKKYRPRGWEAGMDYSRLYGAALRHLNSWFHRDEKDPETGFSHLWHAACCVTFLLTYEARGIGTDDRPGIKN